MPFDAGRGGEQSAVQDSAVSMVGHTGMKNHKFLPPPQPRSRPQRGSRTWQSQKTARATETLAMKPIYYTGELPVKHSTFEDAGIDTNGPAATAAPAEKAAVLSALVAGSDAEVRAALVAALPALEARNPTPEPALSDSLYGNWTVKYTGGVAKGPIDSPTREIALLMYAAGFGPGAAALSLANRLPDSVVKVKTVSLQIVRSPFQSRATLALSFPRVKGGRTRVDAELVCDLSVVDNGLKLVEAGKEVSVKGNLASLVETQYRKNPFFSNRSCGRAI